MPALIYVCSPFAGRGADEAAVKYDQRRNVAFAESSCREITMAGGIPFAPHLFFTRFLNDANPMERVRGITSGLEIMRLADEVWFRIPAWRLDLSTGMKQEHLAATEMSKTIRTFRDDTGWHAALAHLRALNP